MFPLTSSHFLSNEINPMAQFFQIALEKDAYIFVEDNDFLGFTNEESTCPIGYTFQTNSNEPQPYFASLPSTQNSWLTGTELEVDSIGMPYNFAYGAKYDSGD